MGRTKGKKKNKKKTIEEIFNIKHKKATIPDLRPVLNFRNIMMMMCVYAFRK